MTVKKQPKYLCDGLGPKIGSVHYRVEAPTNKWVRAARRYKISVNPSSQEDVLLASPVEKQHQIAVIMQEHSGFDEQDAADFLTFLSIKEKRADLYKRLADS